MSHCRHGLAVTVRSPRRASFWNGIAGQAERHVECDATDDVSADAQPIRGQVRVADPCLQVGRAGRERRPRRDRPRCREEQEIATAYFGFRTEKIVTCREEKRGIEGDINPLITVFATVKVEICVALQLTVL